MSVFVWVGDEKYQSIGEKTKNQTITFDGSASYYTAYGDVRYEMLNSRGGNDVIIGATGANYNVFCGESKRMVNSVGGNDRLIGSDSADYNALVGDAIDLLGSKGGNDVLIGGANTHENELTGDAYYMAGDLINMSFGGNDTIISGDGAVINFMYGDGIVVFGNVFSGNDQLVSGASNDYMWGDFRYIVSADVKFGHDKFVFKENNGHDEIADFRVGEDKIEIRGIEGLTAFSQLQITVQAGSSIITLGTDDTVTVIGVANLQAQDFIFS